MSKRPGTASMLCAVVIIAAPLAASAHAFPTTATPAVGSTIRTAPTEVLINFTEAVEPKFSRITVTDAQGARVDDGQVHLQQGDTHLAVGLKPLAPGRYEVSWHVTATDTHHTQGTFAFTVAP
ncbi:copper resistance CopC family protein [Lichenicola sp.]|uniref:copper resistance CopC family protein n=1 Tax=Lichenicola sp. TaxID=2804529 RepID=UPI003AFF86A2